LVLDCYPFIRPPRAERDLLMPEGTQELLGEVEYANEEKSFFQVRLRKQSFCN